MLFYDFSVAGDNGESFAARSQLFQVKEFPVKQAGERGWRAPVGREDERLLEEISRVFDGVAVAGEAADAALVAAEVEALVKAKIELAAEFADGPVLGGGFDFVKAALVGVLDAEEEDVVRAA